MKNQYFKQTTPEDRLRIRAFQKWLAQQGYYPWGKPPFGFDKVKVIIGPGKTRPTLAPNRYMPSIVAAYELVVTGKIKSSHEASGFLTADLGFEISPTRALYILRNPVYMGMLPTDEGYVKGRYHPPVKAKVFEQVGHAILVWGGGR